MNEARVELRVLIDQQSFDVICQVTDAATGAHLELSSKVVAAASAAHWASENAWDVMAADGVRVLWARPARGEPHGPLPKVMEMRVSGLSDIMLSLKVLQAGSSYYFGLDENGRLVTDLFLDSPYQVEAVIRPEPPSTGPR